MIAPLFIKLISPGKIFWVVRFFSFSSTTWMITIVSFKVSVEKSDINLIGVSLKVVWHFSLTSFMILSLYCTFQSSSKMCCGEVIS